MDRKDKQDYRDDSKIDLKDAGELAYASNEWGVSGESIRLAIVETGSHSRAVIRQYLIDNAVMDEEE